MYVHMQDCTEHFRYQITNKHNHVGYVLESTKTSDASPTKSELYNMGPSQIRHNWKNRADIFHEIPK